MFDWNMITVLEQAQNENPTLFPFPFGLHTTFAILAFLFFVYRFFTDKKPFQLIFAIAIPFSMTLWLSDSRAWFYMVGAIELAFIVCAFLSTFLSKKNASEPETAPADNAKSDTAENAAADTDTSENGDE